MQSTRSHRTFAIFIALLTISVLAMDDTGAQLFFRLVAAAYEPELSASPRTGPSRSGAGSYPSTTRRSVCSTDSCTTGSSGGTSGGAVRVKQKPLPRAGGG